MKPDAGRDGHAAQHADGPVAQDTGRQVAQTRLRLLDLAQDASLYLRRHGEPSVRVAAALLVAASLASCSPSGSATDPGTETPAVPPLAQEVRQGLPTSPGTYALAPNSVTRDAQGVYGFSWRSPTGESSWNQAKSSLTRLAQGTEDTLEVPQSGDPILRLKPDTPIALPDDDGAPAGPTPTPGGSGSTSRSSTSSSRTIAWYPFLTGTGTTSTAGQAGTSGDSVAATTPAYRNPPAADPGQGSVRGSSATMSAPSASARTWTSPSRAAATGQAGGPGRGSAVTSRSGAGGGTASGAARPSSSGFSGGKSGSSSGSSVG